MAGVSERGVDYVETMDGPEILGLCRSNRKARQGCTTDFRIKRPKSVPGFSLNVLSLEAIGIKLRPNQAKL